MRAERHEVTWTCDRCGAWFSTETREFPQTWGQVAFTRENQLDLCDKCAKELAEWMKL